MEENQSAHYVLVIMKNLNFIIILYIAVLMSYTLFGYIQENSALNFLETIYRIPIAAWKIPILSITLYCCCMLLLSMQNKSSWGFFLKVCIELTISFCISYVIGFSYIGMVLLILADTMRYFPRSEWKWRIFFVIVICMLYLLIDYNLLLLYFKITPLENYLTYFQSDVRSILLAIKNILNSFNMLIFILYIILLMYIQLSEKERILSLNETLNGLNEELKQANIRLEEYAKEAEQVTKTKERNRLAMEIHDALGHALTGIITGIEACATLMDIAPEATKEQLKAIAEVARQGMTDVRRSIKALRPDVLEKMDLDKALTQMIDEMRCATNAEILYQCQTELNCFNEEEENTIYRIIQECITNSIRHGKAKQIKIDMDKKGNMLEIFIQDNGIGCSHIQEGFGLYHMEERLNRLQGNLEYNGEKGFIVKAQVPIRLGYGGKQ